MRVSLADRKEWRTNTTGLGPEWRSNTCRGWQRVDRGKFNNNFNDNKGLKENNNNPLFSNIFSDSRKG